MKLSTRQNLTAIWLLALLLNVFSMAVSAGEQPETPTGMVYCPLTKKLQPIKRAERRRKKALDFCASDSHKKEFAAGLLTRGAPQIDKLDRDGFEKLVFDFFDRGNQVFLGLPFRSESPNPNSVNTISKSLLAGSADDFRTNASVRSAEFSFNQNPRPPDATSVSLFESKLAHLSKTFARRIAPRAPPVTQ